MSLRYIFGEGDDMEGAVRRVPHARDVVLYPYLRAVFADIPFLDDEARDFVREHPLPLAYVLLQVVRVDDRCDVRRGQLVRCVARDLIVRRISLEEATFWVRNDHADRGMGEYRLEPLLGRPQLALLPTRILRSPPLGDVADDATVEGPASYRPCSEAELHWKLHAILPQPVNLERLAGCPLLACRPHPFESAQVGVPVPFGHQHG